MSDYQVIKSLANYVTAASKILEDAKVKLASAIQCELMDRVPYTVSCDPVYGGGEFIVRVFNVTDTKIEDVVERLLDDMGVADMADVWTYSPYETQHRYPAYYKEVQP